MPKDKEQVLSMVMDNIENGIIDTDKIDQISDNLSEVFLKLVNEKYADDGLRIILLIMILANFSSEVLYKGVVSCATEENIKDHDVIKQISDSSAEDLSIITKYMLDGLLKINIENHIPNKNRTVH